MSTVAAGKTAPSFNLASTDGNAYSLRDALARGPVLAAFFKVSCPTCQYTLPFLERLYQQFRAQNLQLWGVSQDTARDSQRFAKTYGVTFPILIDEEPYETSQEYGLEYVPTLFLIAADAQVQAGWLTLAQDHLQRSRQFDLGVSHCGAITDLFPGLVVEEESRAF